MTERRRVNAIAEGITNQYKTRKIELEIGYWEIYGICNGCAKKDFLSTKTDAIRTINLKVHEDGNTTKYCSLCSYEALNEINKEIKKRLAEPEIDYEAMNKQIEDKRNEQG